MTTQARVAIPMMLFAAGRLRLAGVALALLCAAIGVVVAVVSGRRSSTRDEDLAMMAKIDRERRPRP